ncbi:MAG TPA: (2Fe-2S)-binding protein [Thermomicrobiales bacterium]|nr:(2Fe-2S)-binding protein [Thermomicrobiales bacterium]
MSGQRGSPARQAAGAARIDDHPALDSAPAAAVVPFSFDGMPLTGREGEPIAAALLAAGVRVFRTMPGSGEPRGGFCLVGRCVDCLVVVDGRPNVRACVTPLRAGVRVETQRGLGAGADFGVPPEPGQ